MRSFVNDVKAEELNAFVLKHPYGHYMKTTYWAEYKKASEGYSYELTGVRDQGKLVAAAVLLQRKAWYSTKGYLYIPTGMCVDYQDQDLVDFFIASLLAYAREKSVSFLRIDPNVLRCHRDILGNRIDDGFSNEGLTDHLKQLGFIHKGYGYAYNGSWINRYTLMIDLTADMDTIVSRFNRSKQNVLKRQAETGIATRNGDPRDIPYFVDFEWELTRKQGFKPHKANFFRQLVNCLGDNLHIYVTEVDMTAYIAYIDQEINGKKYRKDPEALQAKQKDAAKARKLKDKYGKKVVIAVGMFVRYGERSWDLYTYNRKDFNNFNATDNLHRFVIADMKEHGVRLYDMVGFSGVTDKSDPYYGLYDYKRSFGPDFYEHIGQFDYVFDDKQYRQFNYMLYQIKRVRRHWFSMRYKKDE